MGFLDKVKETAEKAGEGIKKGTASVKDRVADSQLQKKIDENAKQIGNLIVQEKTEGTAPAVGEIDRLVREIVDYRAQIAAGAEITEGAEAPKAEGAVQAESAPATPSERSAT
jgi:hypothetical protein